jgi:hypothetical protein
MPGLQLLHSAKIRYVTEREHIVGLTSSTLSFTFAVAYLIQKILLLHTIMQKLQNDSDTHTHHTLVNTLHASSQRVRQEVHWADLTRARDKHSALA